MSADASVKKHLHFVRHGHATCNAAVDAVLLKHGLAGDLSTTVLHGDHGSALQMEALMSMNDMVHYDSPLTDVGRREATALGVSRNRPNADVVVASSLQRSMQTAELVFGDVLTAERPAIVIDELREYLGMPPNHRRTKAEIQAGCNSHLFDLTRIPETDPSLSLLAAQSVTFGELNLSSSGDGDGVGDGGSSNVDSSSRSSSSSSSSVSIDTPRSKPESELKLNERAAAVFQFLLTLPQTSIAMVIHGGFCMHELLNHPDIDWPEGNGQDGRYSNMANCSVRTIELSVGDGGWVQAGGTEKLQLRWVATPTSEGAPSVPSVQSSKL